jgi:hypothetical protein
MFITIINDCKDDNAKVRQEVRYATQFPGSNISFIGIDSNLGLKGTIEAAGNLIDLLDATDSNPGVIALNIAPRGQVEKGSHNGSLFCYFYRGLTLVISTIKGYNLSLVKKLKLADSVNVLDTDVVLDFLAKQNIVSKKLAEKIKDTQFRSFEFQPFVAKWLIDGVKLPHNKLSLTEIPDIPHSIWLIDSFGNAKTTLTKKDINISESNTVKTNYGTFNYYERLKDVPDGKTALYPGSSGIGETRFIEIAVQNRPGSANRHLNIRIGDTIEVI